MATVRTALLAGAVALVIAGSAGLVEAGSFDGYVSAAWMGGCQRLSDRTMPDRQPTSGQTS